MVSNLLSRTILTQLCEQLEDMTPSGCLSAILLAASQTRLLFHASSASGAPTRNSTSLPSPQRRVSQRESASNLWMRYQASSRS